MSWHLKARPLVEDGVNNLSVYLHCTSDLDRWSVVTTYEVRLLSSSSDVVGSDVVRSTKDDVFKNHEPSWGWKRFITVDDLRSGSFIEDDTIKFRVHLTTKNFERIADFE